jgi:hypothetical protein
MSQSSEVVRTGLFNALDFTFGDTLSLFRRLFNDAIQLQRLCGVGLKLTSSISRVLIDKRVV